MALDPLEWIVIAVVVIVLFLYGPGKIPEIARSIGRAKKEFDAASKELQKVTGDLRNPAELLERLAREPAQPPTHQETLPVTTEAAITTSTDAATIGNHATPTLEGSTDSPVLDATTAIVGTTVAAAAPTAAESQSAPMVETKPEGSAAATTSPPPAAKKRFTPVYIPPLTQPTPEPEPTPPTVAPTQGSGPPKTGDELLIETAKNIGIKTEGKTREQIAEEIVAKSKPTISSH